MGQRATNTTSGFVGSITIRVIAHVTEAHEMQV